MMKINKTKKTKLSHYQKMKNRNQIKKYKEEQIKKCLENIAKRRWNELDDQTTQHEWLLSEKLDTIYYLQHLTDIDMGIIEVMLSSGCDERIILLYIHKSKIFNFSFCLNSITIRKYRNALCALIDKSNSSYTNVLSILEEISKNLKGALSDQNFGHREEINQSLEFINPYRHLLTFLINIKKEHEFLKFAKEDTVIFAFRRNPDIITSYSQLQTLANQSKIDASIKKIGI